MIVTQFIKFAIVGVIATIVHAGSVIFLVETFSFDPVISSVPAYIAALITAYLLNKTWSFQSKVSHIDAFLPYTIVSTLGFGLNITIMHVLINLFHVKYYFALAVAVISVPIVTFTLHKYWTFNNKNPSNDVL